MVKSEHSIKKIFYIEKVVFLRSAFEVALKAKGADIYTVDSIENNFYLLNDLSPDLVLFDVQTVGDSLPKLLEFGQQFRLVALGYAEDKQKIEGKVETFLLKPLEARGLASQILALVD